MYHMAAVILYFTLPATSLRGWKSVQVHAFPLIQIIQYVTEWVGLYVHIPLSTIRVYVLRICMQRLLLLRHLLHRWISQYTCTHNVNNTNLACVENGFVPTPGVENVNTQPVCPSLFWANFTTPRLARKRECIWENMIERALFHCSKNIFPYETYLIIDYR